MSAEAESRHNYHSAQAQSERIQRQNVYLAHPGMKAGSGGVGGSRAPYHPAYNPEEKQDEKDTPKQYHKTNVGYPGGAGGSQAPGSENIYLGGAGGSQAPSIAQMESCTPGVPLRSRDETRGQHSANPFAGVFRMPAEAGSTMLATMGTTFPRIAGGWSTRVAPST